MSDEGKHFIIPVFIPHQGCPHKCVFCNQQAITGFRQSLPMTADGFRRHVQTFLNYKRKKRNIVEIAFFGGNFLGMPPDRINSMLSEARAFVESGQVDGIRFSTRPDTIDEKRLEGLRPFPVTTVELGAQSMDDGVLSASQRGHTSADTERGVFCLKTYGFQIGLQMMVGLPGDNGDSSIQTAEKLARLGPDYIRIYPTIVLSGSRLGDWYKNGHYTPWSIEKSIHIVKKIYYIFKNHNIRVIRMGLQASEDLNQGDEILAGPYHPSFGHLVLSSLFLDKAQKALANRKRISAHALIRVHPRNISRAQGLNKSNIAWLKNRFALRSLDVVGDDRMAEDDLQVLPSV